MNLTPVTRSFSILSSQLEALRRVDEANTELRERNATRVSAMKISMGRKYLLHPDNAPVKTNYTPVLNQEVAPDGQTS